VFVVPGADVVVVVVNVELLTAGKEPDNDAAK
jgi:hypothetical protein